MADSQKYTAKLQGKRILIIGGSSGIGYAVRKHADLMHLNLSSFYIFRTPLCYLKSVAIYRCNMSHLVCIRRPCSRRGDLGR